MIPLPSSIKILEKTPQKIIFEIEPLYPGYGTTIGNSLRRILLSSIEGAAITKARIKGVSHEFSTIPGIKEDILEIILNLKQVRLRIFGEESQKIELKESGKKEVKAGDIKTPPQVEVVNKDFNIATLTREGSNIEIEMDVQKGFGYVSSEKFKEKDSKVETIYLDAIFSPVVKVAFFVENIRFEERTDFNKLKMEIETDGTASPQSVLFKALEVFENHLKKIKDIFPKEKKQGTEISKEKEEKENDLEKLGLSVRVIHSFERAGIKSLAGLLRRKEESLKEIEGLGEKGIEEIKKTLKKKGLKMK